jgi:hypothetical protein
MNRKNYKNWSYLALAMVVIVTASNFLVQFPINDWLTWGAFTYPASFLVTELTNRFYGSKQARRVVYVGFCVAALFSIYVSSFRIAAASTLAFLVAQLTDIFIFSRLRKQTWWYAPLCASLLASVVDTSIFWTIAFSGLDLPWLSWAFGDFCIKLLLDILMLSPFRMMIRSHLK